MENGAPREDGPSQAWAAPDQDAPTVGVREAAAALAAAAAAEEAQQQAARIPPWFYISLGLCLGTLTAANAIGTDEVRVAVIAWTITAEVLVIVAMVRLWRRRGMQPRLFSSLDTPVGVIEALALSAVLLGTLLPAMTHPDRALALGAAATSGYIGVCWACETWSARRSGIARP